MKLERPTASFALTAVFFLTTLFLAVYLGLQQGILALPLSRTEIPSTSTTMGGEKLPAMDGGNFNHHNTVAPKEEKVFPLFNNTGKTAIVSGAGAGIGLAVAQALAESGANGAIWYHGNKKALDRAKDIEKEYGVKCMEVYDTARGPADAIA